MTTREDYYNRKAQGMCVNCGTRKAVEGKVKCEICREKDRKYREESRIWAKEKGYCPQCMKNKLFGDEKRCPECLAYMAIVNQKSREKHYGTNHDYYIMDIARLKEKGLCRGCRKNKVAEGHTYCQTCLIKKRNRKVRNYQYEFKDIIPRSERRSYGLCYRCGNPLDSDRNLCSECCEKIVKNFKGIRGTNAYWKADNQFLGGRHG